MHDQADELRLLARQWAAETKSAIAVGFDLRRLRQMRVLVSGHEWVPGARGFADLAASARRRRDVRTA